MKSLRRPRRAPVLLLDGDRPGALATLVEALARTPGAGIAGGGLTGEGGRWQPAAARFGPLAHLLLDTTLGRLGARLRRVPHRVDWVYGTFMAVGRDLFRQLRGFDPRYFLYGEDLDLCYRAARLGARTIHVPAARALHGPNLSAAQRFGRGREAEVVKGEMRFYAARGGPGALRVFRAAAACKFGLKTALAAARRRRRRSRWRRSSPGAPGSRTRGTHSASGRAVRSPCSWTPTSRSGARRSGSSWARSRRARRRRSRRPRPRARLAPGSSRAS